MRELAEEVLRILGMTYLIYNQDPEGGYWLSIWGYPVDWALGDSVVFNRQCRKIAQGTNSLEALRRARAIEPNGKLTVLSRDFFSPDVRVYLNDDEDMVDWSGLPGQGSTGRSSSHTEGSLEDEFFRRNG